MRSSRSSSFLFAATLAASIVGCNDPTKGKTKAEVSEPTASTAAAPARPEAVTTTYAFDASSSKIGWTGSKVTGKHDGGFGEFRGAVQLVDGDPEKSRVTVEITPASVTADADKLVEHLKSADFFDVAKFPKVTFTSTSIKKGGTDGATHTITGNLSFHGVEKAVTFPATVKIEGDRIDVQGEFSLNRKDFGIAYPGKQDDLIRDDVLVRLNIQAKKS